MVIIALAATSLFLFWYPAIGYKDPNLGILSVLVAVGQLALAIVVMVGRARTGRLVLTHQRWKYLTLGGVVLVSIILIMVTQPSLDRPGGSSDLAFYPILISGFVASLYEPERTAQFKLSSLNDSDARTWQRRSLVLALIGVVVGAIAGVAGAAGDIMTLSLLWPIAFVSLVFAAGIWMRLRTRNR
ncbi:hypothetical protein [Arthrobacter sp. B2a2-09]|uniref:hypothetical protein n=1 Tax=Arthrobacter sp. B2a2-09 TaxID=2952822 RepID=UPI0022CDA4A3|nr:hypothetical protein [Arthrobacter sp. B2a2-09]MCZ9882501.1 hypothetical protein [Arthrobacter sp. B2a2-09]